jgi:predicted enzyme related to lactoylglutathione lyase
MTVSVRYIVEDVDKAIPFYTEMLDFKVDMHPGPGFASLSRGEMRLLLNSPGGRGGAGQSMPDGRAPAPGGWLRFQLEVPDIEATVSKMTSAGACFRSDIISGFGGKQVLVDDPSGNPVELFQPANQLVRLARAVLARPLRRAGRSMPQEPGYEVTDEADF